MSEPVLLLGAADLAKLMGPRDYFAAVEDAFRALREGRAESPMPMGVGANGGKFHAKGALYRGARNVVVVKVNGNFPDNPHKFELPTIQGVALLCDADNGAPLALMDSAELTAGRTAAASAVAARRLARSDSSRLAIIGCGRQAMAHARALADVFGIRSSFAWDIDESKADRFAAEVEALDIGMRRARSLDEACDGADIIVTCTTAQSPLLDERHVAAGAFIAAVGADSRSKSEIAPSLMRKVRIVVDVPEQCLDMGDLRHAVAEGAISATDVHADLGDIISGAKPGRTSPDEIFIFDSTGTAAQDAASALLAWSRARERRIGSKFAFSQSQA